MKYFTYELISKANDWVEQSEEEATKADTEFWETASRYNSDLELLKERVSKAAWSFFRFGFGETGLHDSRLLSFAIGDISNRSLGQVHFSGRKGSSARFEFLDFAEKYCHVFEVSGVKKCRLDVAVEEDSYDQDIGDLFAYELSRFDDEHLQIGFIFASGAEIIVVFKKLVYRKHRVPPSDLLTRQKHT